MKEYTENKLPHDVPHRVASEAFGYRREGSNTGKCPQYLQAIKMDQCK